MRRSIVLSAFLHFLIVLAMLLKGGGGGGQGAASEKDRTGEFIPKQQEAVVVENLEVPDPDAMKREEERKKRVKARKKQKCDSWYGGIGVQMSYETANGGRVEIVAPGYPADQAGIVPGDVLQFTEELRGDPGTVVMVVILPQGSQADARMVTIRRDRICHEPFRPEMQSP